MDVFIIALGILTFFIVRHYVESRRHNYPPGPWGFPIVGHLPLFGSRPSETFRRWSKAYGNVFRIRLGSWNTVVLNGYSTIKGALDRTDDAFSSRPNFLSNQMMKESRNNEDGLEFGQFNEAYKKQRKYTAYALRKFTNCRDTFTEHLILKEAEELVTELLACGEKPQDVLHSVGLTPAAIIYQVVFGVCKSARNDKNLDTYVKWHQEFMTFLGSGNPGDVFPYVKFIFKKHIEKYLAFIRVQDSFVSNIVDAHKDLVDKRPQRCITDMFLNAGLPHQVNSIDVDLTEARLLYGIQALLGAGLSTVKETLLWLILYMTKFPNVQHRVQSEIDDVVGKQRAVTLGDRPKLHFTQAIILEVLRLCNILPFTLPHYTIKDTKLNGYDIDKGTVVFVNLASINLDESLWEEPLAFKPERHLNENNELSKRSQRLVAAFGFGRRRCVGEFLAKIELFLIFATLVQRCRLIKPDTEILDTEPAEMLSNSPKHFKVIVKDRN